MGSLKIKFLYQLTASVLHALLPLFTFPYITRVLGPQHLGAINFVDYTAQIFITLANFGIPLYAVREIAKVRDSPTQLQNTISELITIQLFTTFIALASFLLTMRFSPSEDVGQFLVILASLNIFFNAFSLTWFIHGLEDFKTLSIRSLTIKILVTISVFILIKQPADFNKYYSILVSGSFMLIAYDLYYLKKKKLSFAFKKSVKNHIHPLFIFFLTTASFSLYTLFDTFILGVLTTTLAVGYYTTALKIIRLFQSFINSLSGVLLPRIAYLIEQKKDAEISQLLQKSILYVFTIAVPAGFLFFLLAPEIIQVLAGHQFMPSIATLQILSLLPLLIGLSNIFGIQVLVPHGREKQLLFSALIGSLISIFTCIILCPLLQQSGAALATVITELLVTLLMGWFASRNVKMLIPIKAIINICITAVTFIPVIIGIRYIFNQNLLILVLSLLICISIFCSAQFYIFSNSIISELVKFLRSFTYKLKYAK